MQFLQKDAVQLYTRQPPAPHAAPTLGMAQFRDAARTSDEERQLLAHLGYAPRAGYCFRFAQADAPTVFAAYASYLDQLEAWPNADGSWTAYSSLDPDLLAATYEAHTTSSTRIEQLALGHQVILIQREALQLLRALMALHLKSPKIMALLEETLKDDAYIASAYPDQLADLLPKIMAVLDALCRAMRSLMEIADERD